MLSARGGGDGVVSGAAILSGLGRGVTTKSALASRTSCVVLIGGWDLALRDCTLGLSATKPWVIVKGGGNVGCWACSRRPAAASCDVRTCRPAAKMSARWFLCVSSSSRSCDRATGWAPVGRDRRTLPQVEFFVAAAVRHTGARAGGRLITSLAQRPKSAEKGWLPS